MAVSDQRGVFVSWSKPVAREIAKHLKPFLEDVLAPASVFASEAMDGGTRWAMEIPQWLEACNAGVVLVTPENAHAPWLHFEAGALSKLLTGSRVVPLLCGATVGDIQGTPLSLFQAKRLDHDNLLEVCLAFGGAFSLADEVVRRRFEKFWPDLETAVASASSEKEPRTPELGLADLMGVLERLGNQISGIEQAVRRSTEPFVRTPSGMFGGRHGLPTFSEVDPAVRTYATDLLLETFRRRLSGEEYPVVVPVGQPCPISGYWRGSGTEEEVWIEEGTEMPVAPEGGKSWILVRRSEKGSEAGPGA